MCYKDLYTALEEMVEKMNEAGSYIMQHGKTFKECDKATLETLHEKSIELGAYSRCARMLAKAMEHKVVCDDYGYYEIRYIGRK